MQFLVTLLLLDIREPTRTIFALNFLINLLNCVSEISLLTEKSEMISVLDTCKD